MLVQVLLLKAPSACCCFPVVGLSFGSLQQAYCGTACEEAPHLIGDVPRQLSLLELCFWFSVQNLITIGFGNVHPGTTPANILCTAEHFGGIMLSSILLGLVVTKGKPCCPFV